MISRFMLHDFFGVMRKTLFSYFGIIRRRSLKLTPSSADCVSVLAHPLEHSNAFISNSAFTMSASIEAKKEVLSGSDDKTRWENMWQHLNPGEKFDAQKSPPILTKHIEEGQVPEGYALVPGCGRGYDLVSLGSDDRFVVGLEISPTAVEAVKQYLENYPAKKEHMKIMEDDFFTHEPVSSKGYDFIFDYTFFCAMPPSKREAWAKKTASLLKPGGQVWTLVFPIPKADEEVNWNTGPPYPITVGIVEQHLAPEGLQKVSEEPVPENMSHPGREGREILVKWEKI